jgi:hypothetical protein
LLVYDCSLSFAFAFDLHLESLGTFFSLSKQSQSTQIGRSVNAVRKAVGSGVTNVENAKGLVKGWKSTAKRDSVSSATPAAPPSPSSGAVEGEGGGGGGGGGGGTVAKGKVPMARRVSVEEPPVNIVSCGDKTRDKMRIMFGQALRTRKKILRTKLAGLTVLDFNELAVAVESAIHRGTGEGMLLSSSSEYV